MTQFRLNNDTLTAIRANTGMDATSIATSDISQIDHSIERRVGKKLTPSISFGGISPRGSVYLMFKRFFTEKEIDCKLASVR